MKEQETAARSPERISVKTRDVTLVKTPPTAELPTQYTTCRCTETSLGHESWPQWRDNCVKMMEARDVFLLIPTSSFALFASFSLQISYLVSVQLGIDRFILFFLYLDVQRYKSTFTESSK